MAGRSLARWQKGVAVVPMALVVTAWGIALSTTNLANATDADGVEVPDVPDLALDEPATVIVAPGVDARSGADEAVSTLAPNGIPSAALYAYRRAEVLLAKADPDCRLPWHLVAAIGRVESNHGRTNGNSLNTQGVAKPGIYGLPLDGKDGRRRIADTDAGKLDNDTVLDRAVGPMQFIPSTWENVGVDGDGDGTVDPQDIDDAAVAAGVYLCSGAGDLSTRSGAAEAVGRYNHSDSYVELVLRISERYDSGDFTESPNGYTVAPVLTNRSADQTLTQAQRESSRKKEKKASAPKPTPTPTPTPTTGTGGTGSGGTGGTGTGGTGGTSGTVGGGVQQLTDGLGLGGVTKPVTDLLSRTEATLQCALRFPLGPQSSVEACMNSFGY